MIKAVVLDVDGVVVGAKSDQYPHPSKKLTEVLRAVQKKGVHISLLSGKTSFIIGETIRKVGLEGLHVSDSGAVVFDAIRDESVFEDTLDPAILYEIVTAFAPTDISLHAFTRSAYAQFHPVHPDFEEHYIHVMGRTPVDQDFVEFIQNNQVLKLNIYADQPEQKQQVDEIVSRFVGDDIHVNPWSLNPALEDVCIKNVTSAGVSKYSGFTHLLKHLNVSTDEILGVGDTLHDWDFIEHCGYKGVMSNATLELKERYNLKDTRQYMGGHVDDDGLIDILSHFDLL